MTTLAEDLLLLALDDESGATPLSREQTLGFGLAGGVLLELLLAGRLDAAGRNLAVADAAPTGDAVLDDALRKIADARRPRDTQHWVNAIAGDHLRERVLDQLVAQGIVRREEHKILWVFPANRYPTQDPAPERGVREQVRAAVLGGATPEPRVAALIALARACKLDDALFTRDERKAARRRLDEIARGEAVGQAVSRAVEAAQAAVMAATTAAIVASVTASSAACTAATSAAC
jgi:hypothetical protein